MRNKRRTDYLVSAFQEKKLKRAERLEMLLHLKCQDVPLIPRGADAPCSSLYLLPDVTYTIGRDSRSCELLVNDQRVSRRHCQIIIDGKSRKIFIADGTFFSSISATEKLQFQPVKMEESALDTRASLNGVFVNGMRVREATATELQPGDTVSLACVNGSVCNSSVRIVFIVEKIISIDCVELIPNSTVIGTPLYGCRLNRYSKIVKRACTLLRQCKEILMCDDPVWYIRSHDISEQTGPVSLCNTSKANCDDQLCLDGSSRLISRPGEIVAGGTLDFEKVSCPPDDLLIHRHLCSSIISKNVSIASKDHVLFSKDDPPPQHDSLPCNEVISDKIQDSHCLVEVPNSIWNSSICRNHTVLKGTRQDHFSSPPGRNFYLNRLMLECDRAVGSDNNITLPELLQPIDTLSRIFIATFTADVLWFLSYCGVPNHLPVTVACHNTERCWSSNANQRSDMPFADFPNLVIVYPPFPEAIAFHGDKKRQGIGCHHPKLMMLQREGFMRVIITSANLVAKQWNDVTNTLWWQDFPRRDVPDFVSLFASKFCPNTAMESDFVTHLASFIASLMVDVPPQAYWVTDLMKYDFRGATGCLVASVPGLHFYQTRTTFQHDKFGLCNCVEKCLGAVDTSVAGVNHLFRSAADTKGARIKGLALFISNWGVNCHGMSEIILKREENIPADVNAISVLVPNKKDVSEHVQLGFLPRNVAKWVAILWDSGFLNFSGYINLWEALTAAAEGNNRKVHLVLHVSQGIGFLEISHDLQLAHASAICSLFASLQRPFGLSRLYDVLGQYKWPDHQETEFIYSSSSIGSSMNPQFLAAFSAAAGKRPLQYTESEESDPEWGSWGASQEFRHPSIKILFPSIETVMHSSYGLILARTILCFPERAWQRLSKTNMLHDAVPSPSYRAGRPMHCKVVRRRFQSSSSSASFGWVYCGSHNFSAAAWGRPISASGKSSKHEKASSDEQKLHICNYELGIIFVVPPNGTGCKPGELDLDDITMPFVMPARRYGPGDKPATAQAMREALKQYQAECLDKMEGETVTEEPPEDEELMDLDDHIEDEDEEEKVYADILWSELDSSEC